MQVVHWVSRKVCGSMERRLVRLMVIRAHPQRTWHIRGEQMKGLQQPWRLKRTCLLRWKKDECLKTVQKATAHHHGNISLEHQGSQTAAKSKCVHSHPLHTWDPWSWNKSHLCGIDKGAYLIKYKAVCDFSEQVAVFDTPSVSTVDVVAAGNNYLVCLYNGKPGTGLNSLWYNRFWKKR